MKRYVTWLMRAGTLALVAGACGGSVAEAPFSTTTTTMAPIETRGSPAAVIANQDAVERMASARCARESACANIGSGQAFPSYAACTQDAQRLQHQRLSGQLCANGVNGYALSRCLDDIGSQPCGEPGSLDVPSSCASLMLCR